MDIAEIFDALIIIVMAIGIPFLLVMYLLPKEKNTDYKEQYLELKTKYDKITQNQKNDDNAYAVLYQKHNDLLKNHYDLQKKYSSDVSALHEEIQKLQRKLDSVRSHNSHNRESIKEQSERLNSAFIECEEKIKHYQNLISVIETKRESEKEFLELLGNDQRPSWLSLYYKDSLIYQYVYRYCPTDEHDRFWNLVRDETGPNAHQIIELNVSAKIRSKSGSVYDVTPNSCSCMDFTKNLKRSKPCKHILRLAYEMSIPSDIPIETITQKFSQTVSDIDELHRIQKAIKSEKAQLESMNKSISDETAILKSQKQSFPYAAKIISDFHSDLFLDGAEELRNKKPPAMKAADKVSSYAAQLREWCQRAKLAEHRLTFLQYIFPWLEEFDDLPPADAYRATRLVGTQESGYDPYKNWLSPEEYNSLSTAERNQIALDRYVKRPKTNWEAGIEYERYIGYLYEQDNFKVSYIGATKGLEDMGRDLIAQNSEKTYIIQCKRWSQEKTIHEKHIFQLYGTVILYKMDHKSENVQPLFVTTTSLSETANRVAEHLGILVKSDYSMNDYPMIKCNIGKDGSKIYHLPFDLQYDNIVISPEKGEFYANTVEEAESRGFRHAYRWHS